MRKKIGWVGAIGMSCAIAGCASPMGEWESWGDERERVPTRLQVVADPERPSAKPDDEAFAGAIGDPVEIERLVRIALERSPEVEAAYQRFRAALARVPQVGSLPDPSVSLGVFLDEIETRTGAQQARIGVRQGVPWPGLLRARADAATRSARALWEAFDGARLRVRRRVVERASELAYLDAAIDITGENLELLASFEDVVRARYRVGAGSHPDLVRVQVSLGQLEDRLRRLRDMRPAMVAEINELLHRPVDAPIGRIVLPEHEQTLADVDELIARAGERNAELRMLDERVREARTMQKVADLESMPDFILGVDYILTDEAQNPSVSESGDDPVMLMLGISLPIWQDKERARRQEALARRLALAGERASAQDRIGARIARAHFDASDAQRRVELYRDSLIPKAEESLRASLGAYRTGRASFLDLLDAERVLLEFRIAEARAEADAVAAWARLDELAGAPIEPANDNVEETR